MLRTLKRVIAIPLTYAAWAAIPAFGQGCALCWTSANAASSTGKAALNHAILVLLLPLFTLIAGMVGLTVRYSKKREQQQEAESGDR